MDTLVSKRGARCYYTAMEPFRLFFPLGIICGIWGTFLWIPFGFGLSQNYPGAVHPDLMVGGFLFSFATGFLMTAIPKFTGSFPARPWELVQSFLLIVSMTVLDGFSLGQPELRRYSLSLVFIGVVFHLKFCTKRFRRMTHQPPPVFALVGAGLFCGLVGSGILAGYEWGLLPDILESLGKGYLYHGMMLCFVLGVGSKLIPSLMGWAVNPLIELQRKGPLKAAGNPEIFLTVLLAFLILISFVIEVFLSLTLGRVIRAVVASVIGVLYWRLYKKPKTPGNLSRWLRVAGICLVIGLWGYALWEPYAIHAAHIVFIAGFSLLTLLIATRVTLSHGGHNMSLEQTSPILNWTALIILLSAIARSAAPLTPKTYVIHLAFASIIWIIGVSVWGFGFLPKIRKKR